MARSSNSKVRDPKSTNRGKKRGNPRALTENTGQQGKGGKDTLPQHAAARAKAESKVPEVLRTPPRIPAQVGRKKPGRRR